MASIFKSLAKRTQSTNFLQNLMSRRYLCRRVSRHKLLRFMNPFMELGMYWAEAI